MHTPVACIAVETVAAEATSGVLTCTVVTVVYCAAFIHIEFARVAFVSSVDAVAAGRSTVVCFTPAVVLALLAALCCLGHCGMQQCHLNAYGKKHSYLQPVRHHFGPI